VVEDHRRLGPGASPLLHRHLSVSARGAPVERSRYQA